MVKKEEALRTKYVLFFSQMLVTLVFWHKDVAYIPISHINETEILLTR